MKYVDEYRSESAARRYADIIRKTATRPWTLMEICGGQTHTIVKSGLESLLPKEISLSMAPAVPCVSPRW